MLFRAPDYRHLQNAGTQTGFYNSGVFALITLGNKGLKKYFSLQIHVYLFKVVILHVHTSRGREQVSLLKSLGFTAHAERSKQSLQTSDLLHS